MRLDLSFLLKDENSLSMTVSLITGAGGFIGRNLAFSLAERGHNVLAMVRRDESGKIFADNDIEVVVADILDPEHYRDAVQKADQVYHLASVVAPNDEQNATIVNSDGSRMLAECIAEANSPAALVYMSSLSAGGPAVDGRPRKETDEPAPVSIYGRTKLKAERTLGELADRLPISVVRPPGVFGPWDQNLLAMFKSIRSGLNPIGISRRYKYSFVHVKDLVDGLIEVAEKGKRLREFDDKERSGVYFLADDQAVSFEEMGNLVAASLGRSKTLHFTVPTPICWSVAFCSDWYGRLFNKRVYLNIDKIREARAGSWICDSSRAQDELQFRTASSLQDRVQHTHDWYVEHGWL